MELFERMTVDPEVCAVTSRRRSSWFGMASRKRRPGPPLVAAGLAVFLFCAAAFSVPAKASGGFPDLAGHPAEAMVAEAVEAGIVNGYPDGTFRPDAPVTRAEYIKLLVAAGRLRPGNFIGGLLFRDTGGHWLEAAGYLRTAVGTRAAAGRRRWRRCYAPWT